MAIRLAVFDVAGTTVLDGDAVIDAMQLAMGKHGVLFPRDAIRAVMGKPKRQAIRELLASMSSILADTIEDRVRATYDTFLETVIERYRQEGTIQPVPGATDVFRRLRASRI